MKTRQIRITTIVSMEIKHEIGKVMCKSYITEIWTEIFKWSQNESLIKFEETLLNFVVSSEISKQWIFEIMREVAHAPFLLLEVVVSFKGKKTNRRYLTKLSTTPNLVSWKRPPLLKIMIAFYVSTPVIPNYAFLPLKAPSNANPSTEVNSSPVWLLVPFSNPFEKRF